MNKNNYAVIMAGGIGSRFWPMSKKSFPKQFLDILGTGETLIQQTFNRLQRLCLDENIFIVTNKNYKELCIDQLPNILKSNVLCEPIMRNTASCVAYASFKIHSINEIAFYCEPAKYKNFFCTNSQFDEAVLILYLHKLERKKVNGTVDAFRIMPSIHNLTQKTIRSAIVRVSFIGDDDIQKDLFINKKIIHKELSDTVESYLIRSDVPVQEAFYKALDEVKNHAKYHIIVLDLLEVNFQD